MKKIAVLFFLMTPLFVYAEWSVIASAKGGDIYSIDYSTIKKFGSNKRAWTLTSYQNGLGDKAPIALSAKTLAEYNCGEEKYNILSSSYYTQRNGQGELIGTATPPINWDFIQPDSVYSQILRVVCK